MYLSHCPSFRHGNVLPDLLAGDVMRHLVYIRSYILHSFYLILLGQPPWRPCFLKGSCQWMGQVKALSLLFGTFAVCHRSLVSWPHSFANFSDGFQTRSWKSVTSDPGSSRFQCWHQSKRCSLRMSSLYQKLEVSLSNWDGSDHWQWIIQMLQRHGNHIFQPVQALTTCNASICFYSKDANIQWFRLRLLFSGVSLFLASFRWGMWLRSGWMDLLW